jgi:Flp pilus assembly protein TadD
MVSSPQTVASAEASADVAGGDAGRKLALLALLLTAVTYAATLRFEFVFDDRPQIVENVFMRSWSSVPGFFTHQVWDTVVSGGIGNFYRPLFLLWFVLNYKLFGLNPAGWHFTTLAMHLLATWLVYLLARRITGQSFVAGVATLVFGLHPVHIETVSWVSGVTDSLVAVPFIGAFLCFLRARDFRNAQPAAVENRATVWWIASLVLYVVALLIKEPAIVLPALVFAYEALFPSDALGNLWTRLKTPLLSSLPFVAVSAIYLAWRSVVIHGLTHPMTQVSLKIELQTWPGLVWFYIKHLLWPFGISEFYETPYIDPATWRNFGLPLLLVVITLAGLVIWWRRSGSPVIAFCALWIVLPLLPALKIDTFQYAELAHDRYLYLPSIGFAILLGIVIEKLRFGQRRLFGQPLPAAVALLVLAVFYGVGTASQSVQWANTLLLYARGVEVAPNNVHAVSPLAIELIHRQRYQDAIPLLERAVVLAPTDWQARFTLAQTCFIAGRYPEAERHYREAIHISQQSGAEYYFLGLTLMKMNRVGEAEMPLRRAIAILPAGRGFHEALGMVLISRGEFVEARHEFETELQNDPTNANARQQLAALQAKSSAK